MPAAQRWPERKLGRAGLTVGPHGFGAAPIGNLGRVVPEDEWRGAVPAAWDAGVRYFDVAPHYGLGLAECRLEAGLAGLPRNDFIVSTKVGRLLRPDANPAGRLDDEGFDVPARHVRVRDYSRDGVLRSLESSLSRLNLDHVDILFVHDPDDFYEEALDGAFPALEELRAQGVIRSYGAGMNQSRMLADFVRNTDLDVVMLAGRYTLLDQSGLDDLLPTCAERGVSVVAAASLTPGCWRLTGLSPMPPTTTSRPPGRGGPGEPHRGRLRKPRRSAARRRRSVPARPPVGRDRLPGGPVRHAGPAQRGAFRHRYPGLPVDRSGRRGPDRRNRAVAPPPDGRSKPRCECPVTRWRREHDSCDRFRRVPRLPPGSGPRARSSGDLAVPAPGRVPWARRRGRLR